MLQNCIVLHCRIVLYCAAVLYCIVLHNCTVLCCIIVLHCAAELHCIVLQYCIVLCCVIVFPSPEISRNPTTSHYHVHIRPACRPYTELDDCVPIYLRFILILSSTRLVVSFLRVFRQKFCMHLSSLSSMLHIPPQLPV